MERVPRRSTGRDVLRHETPNRRRSTSRRTTARSRSSSRSDSVAMEFSDGCDWNRQPRRDVNGSSSGDVSGRGVRTSGAPCWSCWQAVDRNATCGREYPSRRGRRRVRRSDRGWFDRGRPRGPVEWRPVRHPLGDDPDRRLASGLLGRALETRVTFSRIASPPPPRFSRSQRGVYEGIPAPVRWRPPGSSSRQSISSCR